MAASLAATVIATSSLVAEPNVAAAPYLALGYERGELTKQTMIYTYEKLQFTGLGLSAGAAARANSDWLTASFQADAANINRVFCDSGAPSVAATFLAGWSSKYVGVAAGCRLAAQLGDLLRPSHDVALLVGPLVRATAGAGPFNGAMELGVFYRNYHIPEKEVTASATVSWRFAWVVPFAGAAVILHTPWAEYTDVRAEPLFSIGVMLAPWEWTTDVPVRLTMPKTAFEHHD